MIMGHPAGRRVKDFGDCSVYGHTKGDKESMRGIGIAATITSTAHQDLSLGWRWKAKHGDFWRGALKAMPWSIVLLILLPSLISFLQVSNSSAKVLR